MISENKKKVLVGTVVSHKTDKTMVVAVERLVKHPRYGKYIRKTAKFYAHDPQNSCKEGDVVKIVESRPLSHLKRWCLLEIVQS